MHRKRVIKAVAASGAALALVVAAVALSPLRAPLIERARSVARGLRDARRESLQEKALLQGGGLFQPEPYALFADGRLADDWWPTTSLSGGALTIGPQAPVTLARRRALGVVGYGRLSVRLEPGAAAIRLSASLGSGRPTVALTEGDGGALEADLKALGLSRFDAAQASLPGLRLTAEGGEARIGAITLLPASELPAEPEMAEAVVTLSPSKTLRPISERIYGMAYAPPDYLADLRLPLSRWGGNDKSRYNWAHGNACSAGRDYYFINQWPIARRVVRLPQRPSAAADWFVENNRRAGADSLVTIPTIGWVARDNDVRNRGQGVPKAGGDPLGDDPHGAIAGYDPAPNRRRTSRPSFPTRAAVPPALAGEAVVQDEWVRHLVARFGSAKEGGVRFFAMDNEPDLWHMTHTDVHPARLGYEALFSRFYDYARAVKEVDPSALVTGPVSWGWTGYFFSPRDEGTDRYRTHAERKRHGDLPLLLWFLQRVREEDERRGRRTLDVLDIHYYPQGGLYSKEVAADAAARRLRATRSLWDPGYVDESWIGEPVRLIPRMKEWIDQGYPGTLLGVTEWNFGADHTINGGLAIAEALGIFGREGVDLACYWAYPPKDSPGYLAFKLFRNPDGSGEGFGDRVCAVEGEVPAAPGALGVYAATQSRSGALTVVAVNRLSRGSLRVRFRGAPSQKAQLWRLSGASARRLIADNLTGDEALLPPASVTLLRWTPGS